MNAPALRPAVLRDMLADVLRHRLRQPIKLLGRFVADGGMPFEEALASLMTKVVDACRLDPILLDDLHDLEDEVADELADAAAAAEDAQARAHPPAPSGTVLHRARLPAPTFTGLPAYYPAITEPRVRALARLDTIITETIEDAARIGAARRELRRRRDAELPYLVDTSPAAKGAMTRRLHGAVAAERGFGTRIPVSPRVLVSGSQGIGKTRIAVRAVAGIRDPIAVRWTEPSVAKCDEVAQDYAKAARPSSLPHLVVRGRAQDDPSRPPGTTMCQRHEVAEQVAAAGVSVRATLCPTCPLARGCGYLAQAARIEAMGGTGVFFMAAAGLFVSSPAPAADLLIGDERIDARDLVTVPLAALDPGLVPYRGGTGLKAVQDAHRAIEAVRDALAQPHQLAALRAAGVTEDALRATVRLLDAEARPDPAGITGSLSDAEIMRRIAGKAGRGAALALVVMRAVLREFDRDRPGLVGVTLDAKDMLTVSRRHRVQGIAQAGVLLLDGTGTAEGHQRALFGARLRHEVVRVERKAHVTGTRGRGYSRQAVTGADMYGNVMPFREDGARRLRDEVATIAARLPGPCLVVADQNAEAALADHLPDDAPMAHYGALRGRNTWEGCETAVVVGPPPLAMGTLEALARCDMADGDESFTSSDVPVPADWPYRKRGWPYWSTRMRRMRDGTLSPVEVPVHPDPRVQAVWEELREAELVQAADRTRPMFEQRTLVLLNSLALDVTYDVELTHSELVAGGTRWDRAWAATGIIPLGERDLHAMHPGLFPSQSAARDWLKALKLKGGVAQTGVCLGNPPIQLYRRKGQHGGRLSRVLMDLRRHPDPRAALTAGLGPLSWFEAADPAQAAPCPVPSPAAVVYAPPPLAPPRLPVPVPILVPMMACGPPRAALTATLDDDGDGFWPIGPPGWPSVSTGSRA